jgi:pimeloyl-ACP methyl ester carboxylesterase
MAFPGDSGHQHADESSMTESSRPGDNLFSAAQPLAIADQGCFYVGGSYARDTGTMSGQMFVQYQVPAEQTHPYPLVMIHGGGQTGVGFLTTPDRRRGWADYFVARGFAVYVVDVPGRGRSQGHDAGDGVARPARTVASRVSDTVGDPRWPQARLHTQWPEGRLPGDPNFDQFYASQVAGSADGAAIERLVRHAGAELLDQIGPAILLAHSLGAPLAWQIADEQPELTRAIVAVEPTGPPVYDIVLGPEGFGEGPMARPWGITQTALTYAPPVASPDQLTFVRQREADSPELARYWLQEAPARQLVNLARVRVAVVSAEASYHAPYDHGTSAYLTQAGVHHDFIRLADHGIRGNGHMMMLEKNNLEIAAFLEEWITATD